MTANGSVGSPVDSSFGERWRLSLEEPEFQSGRAIQIYSRQRENLQRPKYGSFKKRWNYDDGTRYTVVRLEQVQNAAYHIRLGQEMVNNLFFTETGRSITSWIHVYDMMRSGRFAEPQLAHCRFKAPEFHVESLDQLRQEVLLKPAEHGRLVVVEDMLPPVMEVLGQSWNLPAAFFRSHVGSSWGRMSHSLDSLLHQKAIIQESLVMLAFPQPALFQVSHQNLDLRSRGQRRGLLTQLASQMQDLRMWWLINQPARHQLSSIAFEHVTIIAQMYGGDNWRAVIALPPSANTGMHSHDGILYEMHRSPTMHMQAPASRGLIDFSNNATSGATSWLNALESASSSGRNMRSISEVLRVLLQQALNAWTIHVVHVTRASELILSEDPDDDALDSGVETHQRILALVVKDMSVLAELVETLEKLAKSDLDSCAEFASLNEQLEAVRLALERLVPTLQHRIDILVTERQSELARLQLEESRKAIQQADTIKRLTILAFVYIPIQTAAAIFGMNVDELRSFPSIWKFFVVMLCLLLATIFAASWHQLHAYGRRVIDRRALERNLRRGLNRPV